MADMMNKIPGECLEKTEPAKAILENIDAILKELASELVRIDSAIYSPEPCEERSEPQDECMLATLNRQRNTAKALLKIAVHIREGLW
ncbi:MAG: hypothetical protein IJL43_00460 [Lachnospiraceae bacterium]|nr:hypothetical protein [Lachnospiraceae bacterium]